MLSNSMKVRAKKSLGQNFLKSRTVLDKLIIAGELSEGDTVLEVGPGKGALTELLLGKAGKVIAVETDYALFEFLKGKFAEELSAGRLMLIRGDILHYDISKHASSTTGATPRQGLGVGEYKVVANIPYNITGAILKKFLTADNQPELMILMVQKEVAERIMGNPRQGEVRKESILSLSVKAYGTPERIAKVPASFFSPRPKVDSAIIKIGGISRENFASQGINEEKFFEIVRAGFGHKRKKLGNNLKNLIPEEKLKEMGFADQRAEDLTLEKWFALAKLFQKHDTIKE